MIVAPAENAPTMTLADCGSLLLRLKRAICHALASRDSWVERSRVARRALARLNGAGGAHLIFIRRAIGAVYAEAKQRIREANAVLREGGQHLIRIGDVIDRSTSFAERCMLLGVSPADRHELPSDAGFAAIIGLGFEVSSQYRIYGSERGPLFHAVWPLFVDAMFVPGRELAEMTRYRRHPDGSLVRARPAARVLH